MHTSTDLRIADYAPGAAMAPHGHDDASFGLIVGGEFIERLGSRERHYRAGFVTFAPAGVVHAQKFGAAGARQIIFALQPDWLGYFSDSGMALEDSPYASSTGFQGMGRRLLNEMNQADEFSAIACEGIVLEIVAAFGRTGATQKSIAAIPAWLRTARDFMQEHALLPLSMGEIARAAGRHEIHLAREFKRYFGLSAGAYLRQMRVENAARLLRQPRADITEIALRCGFASHSHLCRVFKAHFGVTPSQYRG